MTDMTDATNIFSQAFHEALSLSAAKLSKQDALKLKKAGKKKKTKRYVYATKIKKSKNGKSWLSFATYETKVKGKKVKHASGAGVGSKA